MARGKARQEWPAGRLLIDAHPPYGCAVRQAFVASLFTTLAAQVVASRTPPGFAPKVGAVARVRGRASRCLALHDPCPVLRAARCGVCCVSCQLRTARPIRRGLSNAEDGTPAAVYAGPPRSLGAARRQRSVVGGRAGARGGRHPAGPVGTGLLPIMRSLAAAAFQALLEWSRSAVCLCVRARVCVCACASARACVCQRVLACMRMCARACGCARMPRGDDSRR